MASSNFYTSKMTTTVDTSTSSKPKTPKAKKTKKSTTAPKTQKKAIKEDEPEKDDNQTDNNEDANKTDDGKKGSDETSSDEAGTEKEEVKEIASIEDFIKETKTSIEISVVGKEPSGLDDNQSDKNKIKVVIKNENGQIGYFLWDSSESGKISNEVAMKKVMSTLDKAGNAKDVAEFRELCGFQNVEDTRASRAYDSMKKAKTTLQKMYPDGMYETLQKLTSTTINESDVKCEIKSEDDKFSVYDSSDVWLASFPSKEMADKFAKDYPKLYKDYMSK